MSSNNPDLAAELERVRLVADELAVDLLNELSATNKDGWHFTFRRSAEVAMDYLAERGIVAIKPDNPNLFRWTGKRIGAD